MVFDTLQGNLGVNPVETLTHFSGEWAVNFLWLCLLITPLQRLLRPPLPPQIRRILGVYGFLYALLHLLIYCVLDQGLSLPDILEDITKRPYIIVGMLAFFVLLPMALTSNRWMIRKLASRWKKLHNLLYIGAVLVTLHLALVAKADIEDAARYLLLLIILLGLRLALILYPKMSLRPLLGFRK